VITLIEKILELVYSNLIDNSITSITSTVD